MRKLFGLCALVALLALAATPTHAVSEECTSSDGTTRRCTITEALDNCLYGAIDAAEQRVDEGGPMWQRFIWFSLDVAGCALAVPIPFV